MQENAGLKSYTNTVRNANQYLIRKRRKKMSNKKKAIEKLPLKNIKKTYKIILCDPPWRFETWSEKGKGRGPEQHYETISLEEIKALAVDKLADKNCALFLWVTSPMLEKAFEVIHAWGFEYKCVAFNWIKRNADGSIFKGLGFHTRSNAEWCLLATKGAPKRISCDVEQVLITKLREHSRKPDEIRNRIVKLYGDVTRIELFARQRFDGWDVWGNEAPQQIQKLLEEE